MPFKPNFALSQRLACIATLLAFVACTSPAPVAPLAPNQNLLVQGIPSIPQSLVERVAKYTEFRGHGFVDWHPKQAAMLVTHRRTSGSTVQLAQLSAPLAAPEWLTDFPDPVYAASYEPRDGKFIVYARSEGGSEADQLYRLDLATKASVLLTDPREKHTMHDWTRRSGQLLTSSVPLDKTAAARTRANVTTRFDLIDPLDPKGSRKQIADLPGGGWFGAVFSFDDRRVALTQYLSAAESNIWVIDTESNLPTQLLPTPGSTERASHFPVSFTPDGTGLYFISDRAGEFRELMLYSFETRSIARLTSDVPWDVENASLGEDGKTLAVQLNIDGRSEVRLIDTHSRRPLASSVWPPGSASDPTFHRRRSDVAFVVDGAQSARQIYTFAPHSGQTTQWTQAVSAPGIDASRFAAQSIVRWPSFDGRSISGLLTIPPPRFVGKRPVVIMIHGGPEAQSTMQFMGRWNYLVEEMGAALIQPNVRGSSGYGKAFLALDNGRLRENSVKDVSALLDWIAKQPNLDASRVVVTGGSYGGYMSLALAAAESSRIAGAIDVVGISDFVTFLENTESYRRDLRRAEYGDERDPEMRAFLRAISPLANAQRIKKPLFVVQGKNDPRVPFTEAEQIVAKVRSFGTPVWYLRADNEGHGFSRKENSDFQFYATIQFLEMTLGLGAAAR